MYCCGETGLDLLAQAVEGVAVDAGEEAAVAPLLFDGAVRAVGGARG